MNAHLFIIFGEGVGWYGRWVRRLTRFPAAHVVVAWRDQVLSANLVRLTGNRQKVYDLDTYLWNVKGLQCVFWVSVTALPPPPVSSRGGSMWAAALRWATRGLTNAHDCVSTSVGVLRMAGVAPPRGTSSPRQLHQWLQQQGYAHDTFESHQGATHTPCGYPVCGASGVHQVFGHEVPASGGDQRKPNG